MQPDMKYYFPPVSSQEPGNSVVLLTENRPVQFIAPVEKAEGHYISGNIAQVQEKLFRIGKWGRKPSPTTWRLILIIGDGLVLMIVALISFQARLSMANSILGTLNASYIWVFLVLAMWSIIINITRAQQIECAASLLKSPLYALYSLVLMLVFSSLFLYLFIGNQVISYARPLLFFFIIAAPILMIWRVFLAEVINLPRFRRQAVIVGANASGENMARELLSAKHPGVNVLGYISEYVAEPGQLGSLPIFGGRSSLRGLVQSGVVDMMIMAIDFKANPELFQEALEGAKWGITVVPVTAVYEGASGKIPVEHIGDQWYIALPEKQFLTPLYICWRKVIDLAFGVCGLVVLGLVLPVMTLLIYLDSPGPVFFSQERAGYRGRTFRILKFRSMSTGAERAENGAWTAKNDVRVTRIGRILRVTHLDELPQALNIVRGEMSLIGPRPERPEYVAELAKHSPFYSYRLSAKPGLTGWAQVKYGYGSGEQDELVKLQYDLYYIKHQSFLLDMLIILKTIAEVVLCHGV
jgi:exopolysaccharide biosynthesis polyprenyl glycosylphosphotransferase